MPCNAVIFSHKVGAAGRVVSFEPQKLMYMLLATNTIMSSMQNVELHNAALSFKHGMVSMGEKLPDGVSQGQNFDTAVRGIAPVNFGGRALGRGGELVSMFMLDSFNITDVRGSHLRLSGWGPVGGRTALSCAVHMHVLSQKLNYSGSWLVGAESLSA